MFNNPYFSGFNGYREPNGNQPIQNIINTQIPTTPDIFIARFVRENENIDNVLITNKTAFIDLKNNKLIIKDMDLNKKVYDIIPPKDEKDLQIESLQQQILELKGMMMNESNANVTANNESTEQNGNGKKSTK